VDERAQAHLAVVHQGPTTLRKCLAGGLVARSVAGFRAKATFAAAAAVDIGFDLEERLGVELVGRLTAASDVADRRAHTEKNGEGHQEGPSARFTALGHGKTS
jgi:hypothetical protein